MKAILVTAWQTATDDLSVMVPHQPVEEWPTWGPLLSEHPKDNAYLVGRVEYEAVIDIAHAAIARLEGTAIWMMNGVGRLVETRPYAATADALRAALDALK